MDGEITKSVRRYWERVEASGASHGDESTYDQMRIVWSGLDVDVEEMIALKLAVRTSAIDGFQRGMDPFAIAGSMYLDGIAVGLLVAEARAKAEVGS